MSSKGGSIKLDNGLTPKQNIFVQEILKQIKTGSLNLQQAALKAYDTDDKDVANAIGNENLSKPIIREKLSEILSGADLTLENLASGLSDFTKAKVKDITGDQKLRALDMAFKLHGAYPNNKKTEMGTKNVFNFQQINYSDAKKQLQEVHGESSEFLDDAD